MKFLTLLLAGVSLFAAGPNKVAVERGRNLVFPMFAEGAGAQSVFHLVNLDDKEVTFLLIFFDYKGERLTVPLVEGGDANGVRGKIGPNATQLVATAGTSPNLNVGYALVLGEGEGDAQFLKIGGSLSVRDAGTTGLFTQPWTVVGDVLESRFVVPFDTTKGAISYVNVVSFDTRSKLTATLAFRDLDGNSLGTFQSEIEPANGLLIDPVKTKPELKDKIGMVEVRLGEGALATGQGVHVSADGDVNLIAPVSLRGWNEPR